MFKAFVPAALLCFSSALSAAEITQKQCDSIRAAMVMQAQASRRHAENHRDMIEYLMNNAMDEVTQHGSLNPEMDVVRKTAISLIGKKYESYDNAVIVRGIDALNDVCKRP